MRRCTACGSASKNRCRRAFRTTTRAKAVAGKQAVFDMTVKRVEEHEPAGAR